MRLWWGRGWEPAQLLLGNREDHRHSWQPRQRSAGELQAATALTPSSSARGAAALLASGRVFYRTGKDEEIPLSTACRRRNK